MPKTKPLKTGRTEAQVLAQVIEAAAMLGIKLDRRNTGAATNPAGKMVHFNTPGDSDLTGVLVGGRRIDVEVKREDFDPNRLSGAKREHFDRQLARLKEVNDLGGIAFWTDSCDLFIHAVRWCIDGGSIEEPGYGKLVLVPKGKTE